MCDITTLAAVTIEKLTATFEPGHVNEKELSVLSDVFDTIKGLVEALEAAERRLVAMESTALAMRDDMREARALTVKLPERCDCCYSESEAAMFDGVVEEYTEALESACDAAGIKLQIEE